MTSKPERIIYMNCYCHFTIQEREKLLLLIAAGKKNSEIAKALNRSTSTISREIRRNTRERRNEYSAVAAQQRYYTKRKNSVRKYILANSDAAKTVSLLLEKAWSPEQISNRLKYEKSKISVSQRTIYRAIEKGLIDPTLRKKLRYKGKIHNGRVFLEQQSVFSICCELARICFWTSLLQSYRTNKTGFRHQRR